MRHLLAALALAASPFVPATGAAEPPDKPNFLWIISEDNSAHFLKHWDKNGAPAPHIENLAARGITFDRAFSNSPVCSVARTTLISSCYAPRIGTQFHRHAKIAPMPDGVKMFPAYLRDAGYYTTNNAKTDYNATPGKGVWDDSSRKAHWRNRVPGQPFFHKLTLTNSHESSLHFSADRIASTPTATGPASVTLPPIHPDTPTFRYTYAAYHDRIRDVDSLVGKTVAELETDGLLENTFIFYFGDHGGVLPRSKGYAYQTGLHIPLAVRIPKNFQHLSPLPAGSRTSAFVSFVDFGPTLLNLAGLTPPEGVDGSPFLGQNVTPSQLAERRESFGYADRFDEKYDLVRTLRQGDFSYVRSYQPFNFDALQNDYRYKMLAYREWRQLHRAGKLTPAQSAFFEPRAPEALYDLARDPYETQNLAADPAHAATLATMRSRLAGTVRDLPDLSFFPEPTLIAEALGNPVAYGQKHRSQIADLAGIADLQLLPFSEAEPEIAEALASPDKHHRYWALIVCSSFGKIAAPAFAESAKKIAAADPSALVRTRAAEFLGLTGSADPRPAIAAALKMSTSPTATNLILNSAVLLQDGGPAYQFTLTKDSVHHLDRYIGARLAYLAGQHAPPKPPNRQRKEK